MAKKAKIENIKAREILDSRGNPTIEVELETNLGIFSASVPSGASKGKYEAKELRDGGRRYQGLGVLKAVRNVNKIIAPKLKGKDFTKQKEIDNFLIKLDGKKNKSRLGANSILAVSLAVCRAGAMAKKLPLYYYISQLFQSQNPHNNFSTVVKNVLLPMPSFNVINGGAHAGNDLDFQEFMIVPQEKSLAKNLEMAAEIYHQLKKIIKDKYLDLGVNVGDEGGFASPLRVPEEALDLILEASEKLNYQKKIKFILDIAASQFYKNNQYQTKFGIFSKEKLSDYYLLLISKYPILGLEDPFAEDDLFGWNLLESKVKEQKSKILIVGDDLLATNPQRIKMAKEKNLCDASIIKLNQIGTVTEAIEAVKLAKSFGWKIIVSHRSGETNDDFVADFAVGVAADFVKFGAPARGERVAKYNRLVKIEEELRLANKLSNSKVEPWKTIQK